ncbi:MAG: LysR family transcriptional regulator [Albidovulum sp.]|nr:LysR family transcriptional regulator [Albidovulum sp.]
MYNEPLPPLNSLQAFEAAGRHESFLHAAAELQVSPDAVSRHVRLLERFLGTELFLRRTNGVRLTPAGNAYARKISRIVRDLRRATADVRRPDTAG